MLATLLTFLGKITSVAKCSVDPLSSLQITLFLALRYPLEACLVAMEAGVLQVYQATEVVSYNKAKMLIVRLICKTVYITRSIRTPYQ